MGPETGDDLPSDLLVKIEDLLHERWNPEDSYVEAQLRELAFWRWVAYNGYSGRPPLEFRAHQEAFMLSCFRKTGWNLEGFKNKCVFELGCGPLGMIEFIPAHLRIGYDPLNGHYGSLFKNLRSESINYISEFNEADFHGAADLSICFNVLDHTSDFDYWLDRFFRTIKLGGRFILQVNTVKTGYEYTSEHRAMHPSPISYDDIARRIMDRSQSFDSEVSDTPSKDNEFFFMAWGVVYDRY